MDDDFRILFDYVEQMEREVAEKTDLQTKSAEDEEKKCVHESIETEEAYVCCKCGLVLEDIFQPDIHWCDHALMPRIYGGADRLNAMHKVLIKFLDKISFCTYLPMYTLEERLRDMKIDSGFKVLIMRSAWCASSKEMNRLNNKSVHTCPVQTWSGQEVFIYSHPYPKYSWETGWEICSNQLEETSPIDRKNVGWWTIKKTSRSTRHRHRPDVDRQDTLSWIASFPATAPDHNRHFSGNWLYPMTLSKCWSIVCFDAELCPYGMFSTSRTFHKVKGQKVAGKCWIVCFDAELCPYHSRTFHKVKGQKVAGKMLDCLFRRWTMSLSF